MFADKEVANGLDDAGNTREVTDEDDLVNVGLVNLRVAENLLYESERRAEEVLADGDRVLLICEELGDATRGSVAPESSGVTCFRGRSCFSSIFCGRRTSSLTESAVI